MCMCVSVSVFACVRVLCVNVIVLCECEYVSVLIVNQYVCVFKCEYKPPTHIAHSANI